MRVDGMAIVVLSSDVLNTYLGALHCTPSEITMVAHSTDFLSKGTRFFLHMPEVKIRSSGGKLDSSIE